MSRTSCMTSAHTWQIGHYLYTVQPPQLEVRVCPLHLLHQSNLLRLKFFMILKRRLPQYPNINNDEPYIGTSFGQGSGGFNQFGSMERAIFVFDYLSNPGLLALHGTKLVSSSRGYGSQQWGDAGAPISFHVANRIRLQRFIQGGRSALHHQGVICIHWMCHPLQ